MRICFACMYESLPDISPKAFCILIASHLPYVFSICPSLHPSLHHLIPLQHMNGLNIAEAALDPVTEPFKVTSGLSWHVRREKSEGESGAVCRNRGKTNSDAINLSTDLNVCTCFAKCL